MVVVDVRVREGARQHAKERADPPVEDAIQTEAVERRDEHTRKGVVLLVAQRVHVRKVHVPGWSSNSELKVTME